MLFATVVFWTISLFCPKEKVTPKDLLIIAVGGFLGFVFTQLSFAMGLQYTTPVNFSLIVALGPMVVMLLSAIFLKEKITRNKIIGIVLAISGVLLLILNVENAGRGKNDLLGILLAFVNITCLAIYMIITKKVSQKYTPITLVKWMFLFSLFMLMPFGIKNLFTEKIFSGEATFPAISAFSFVLVFSTVVTYFLFPIALKRLKATTVSIYMNLQPIIASTVAIIIGQDVFTWDKLIAALLVISGVYIVTQKG